MSTFQADKTVYNRLSKTAYPFSVCSNGDSHGDKPIAADLKGDNVHRDMWVGTDDVIEIFRLTGLSVTSATVDQSVRALQHLLPGIPEGKLCFQVHKAIYYEQKSYFIRDLFF